MDRRKSIGLRLRFGDLILALKIWVRFRDARQNLGLDAGNRDPGMQDVLLPGEIGGIRRQRWGKSTISCDLTGFELIQSEGGATWVFPVTMRYLDRDSEIWDRGVRIA